MLRTLAIRGGCLLVAGGLTVVGAEPAAGPVEGDPLVQSTTLDAPTNRWAGFVEPGFPFFSSVVDARAAGPGWPTNNLTVRGLVFPLGRGLWACFDTDLLRVAAVWQGSGVTPVSMAQGSYHEAGRKAPEGEDRLPVPDGIVRLATGLYPGWQSFPIRWEDPRDPGPDPRELGRGALPPDQGRFRALRLEGAGGGVHLEYRVAESAVTERMTSAASGGAKGGAGEVPVFRRRVRLDRVSAPLALILGRLPRSASESGPERFRVFSESGPPVALREASEGTWCVHIPGSAEPVEFVVQWGPDVGSGEVGERGLEPVDEPAPRRWPEEIRTRGRLAPSTNAYVLDAIGLPVPNPWRRNVRLSDVAFFPDGRAAAVTFDGDVWMIKGLRDDLSEVVWSRWASGLHEPLGICVRAGEVFVHDRNGLWRLRDRDGNGEAEVHDLWSNAFVQTAETREFASGLRLLPDGAFVIASGGQRGNALGRHSGMVLRVSADGSGIDVLAHGLRQPFIGVHPGTGVVTASDQQGHHIPATPLHWFRGDAFHGFLPLILPKGPYPEPIAEPLTWIPHPINPSGAGQVWLAGARMGPLNGALIHLGYYRPELFRVLVGDGQAAVVSLTRELDFAPLAGAVNPADGQLYVTGFQIWGTVAREISGLARWRHTGGDLPSTIPRALVPMREGVLVRFDTELDRDAATRGSNYSAERWNYVRSAAYGSPHFKLDGSKGQEPMAPSGVYLSEDRRAVFVALPGMQPVMQMRLGWSLTTRDGRPVERQAYFTPRELEPFDPVAEGFGRITVDLTPRAGSEVVATPVTAEEGRRLAEVMGCVACHSTDGTTVGKVGPTWKGLFGSRREFADGAEGVADDAYLRESMREPGRRVVKGYDRTDTGMPSYEGVLTDAQIEALVLYLRRIR